MTLLSIGMAQEFKDYGICVNTLWPETYIATAAVTNNIANDEAVDVCRKPDIMADAAWTILTSRRSGQNEIDEGVLRAAGVTDFTPYACNPATIDRIQKDFSWIKRPIPLGFPDTPYPQVLRRLASAGKVGRDLQDRNNFTDCSSLPFHPQTLLLRQRMPPT